MNHSCTHYDQMSYKKGRKLGGVSMLIIQGQSFLNVPSDIAYVLSLIFYMDTDIPTEWASNGKVSMSEWMGGWVDPLFLCKQPQPNC